MSVDITTIGVGFDTSGLEKGTAALGRTEQAANKAATAADKVTSSGMFLNESQRKTKEAVEAAQASIDKQIISMQQQAASYGMSARQAELYKLSLSGATDAQLKQANAALKSVESMDKARAMGEQMGSAIKYGTLAAVAGIVAATMAIEKLIGAVAKYQDLAEQTGGDPAGIASLRTAADVGGTSIESLAMAANRLQLRLSKVNDESKGTGKALAAIGIEVNAFKQLRPDEQMRELGKALNQYADGGTKVAVIQGILGRGGAAQLSALKELGSEQVKNNGLTNEQIQLADDYKDAQARAKSELIQTAESMSTQMLPALIALTGASKDVIGQMFGVSSTASDLERNKAIQAWAKDAAEMAAFLADALFNLINIAKHVANEVQLTFANVNLQYQRAMGIFDPNQKQAIASALKERDDVYQQGEKSLNDLLTKSSQFRDALSKRFTDAEIARAESLKSAFRKGETGGTAGKPKIEYDDVTGGGKSGGRGGASKVSDYDRAIKAADSYIAKLKEEATETGATAEQVKMLQAAREATKAPTAALKLMIMTQALANEQLRDAVASANKQALAAIEIEKELAKSKLDTINANADQVEKIQESTQSVQDQIKAERDHIAEMGLSKEALNALEIARINDNASGKDRMATLMQEIDPAIAQAYRDQAEALRGLAAAKGDANAKAGALNAVSDYDKMANSFEGMANTASKMGDGFKKATAALGGFSNAFKTLANAEKNTKADTQERVQAQVGGYAEMAGAAKQFFDEGTAGYEIMAAIEKAMFIAKFAMQAQEVIGNMMSAQSTVAKVAVEIPAETALLAVKGANAVLNQGTGDPYTAFFRMAAMAALVASVISGVGGSGGGGGGGGGGSGGGTATGSGGYEGAGGINRHGQYDQNQSVSIGESSAAQAETDKAEAANAAAKALNELNQSMRVLKDGATALEQDLIDVRKAAQGAGRAQYEMATKGMSEAELQAYNYNAALEGQISVLMDVANGTKNASKNSKALADETMSLSIELMKASGDIAGARALQRDMDTVGYTAGEIAHYDYNASLQATIDAMTSSSSAANDAARAEEELARTRYEVAGRLNVLLGRQTQIQFDRATELAGATDETVIAMLKEIYKIEDLTAARDASFATLERSIAAERKLAEARLKGATDLQSLLKTSKEATSQVMSRDFAQSQIAMYVALAKAGGVLPTAAALKPALDVIAKPSENLFRTFEEYALDQAHTAKDISDLAGFADTQVSVEQQTVDRLDLQLETAKNQLDVLKGVDNSVLSVAEAVRNFEASMLAVATAQASAGSYSFAAPVASTSYSGGGGGGYSGGGASSGIDAAIAGMDKDIVAAYQAYYGRNPDQGGYDSFIKSGLTGDKMMQAILRASIADKSGADYLYAISKGFDPENPLANYYHGKGTYKATTAVADTSNSYAVGSNYIPYDQTARIHQGEEITPRPYVDMQRASRDETNALMKRLVESNEELKAEVMQLRKSSERGNENTRRAADTLQGQQGVPFLVTIAT